MAMLEHELDKIHDFQKGKTTELARRMNNLQETYGHVAFIMYDGCHKIYLITEKAREENPKNAFNHMNLYDFTADNMVMLYNKSCPLVFIQAIIGDRNLNESYRDIIGQL